MCWPVTLKYTLASRLKYFVYKTPAYQIIIQALFGRPFIGPLSCLSCLFATLMYSGQTVGWIKMKLDMVIGLGPGHIVLDGDPAPFPPKGQSTPPLFGPSVMAKRRNGRPSQQLLSSCFASLHQMTAKRSRFCSLTGRARREVNCYASFVFIRTRVCKTSSRQWTYRPAWETSQQQ